MTRPFLKLMVVAGAVALSTAAFAQQEIQTNKTDLSKPPMGEQGRGMDMNGAEGHQCGPDGHPPRPTREQHEALKTCAKKSGITLPDPTPGSPPPRPSDAERKVMDACMDSIGMKRPSGPAPEMHQQEK